MEREIEKCLLEWKNSDKHLPVIIRGARQIGKTFTIEKFGKQNFSSLVTINFEYQPNFSICFSDLNPEVIIRELEILSGNIITPGETLLFLDEIQECPQAILSLRYFKERMPRLHILCAGSLLEFSLNSEKFRMPVGRIEFLYMQPMSFKEFLWGLGEHNLLKHLSEETIGQSSEVLHWKSIDFFRIYLITGGMPAVVSEYRKSLSLLQAGRQQNIITDGYSRDFGKYSSKAQIPYLQKVYTRIGVIAAQPIKYVKIDPDVQARELKKAIDALVMAGVLYKILQNSGSGIPLQAGEKKRYKLLFLDTGLYINKLGMDFQGAAPDIDINLINSGTVAEHIVGQELLACQKPYKPGYLCYWHRESRNSSAEVDYLYQSGEHILPIEVKAGSTGRLKSLRMFMDEKKSPMGIRISQLPLSYEHNILSIPFYLIHRIGDFVHQLL